MLEATTESKLQKTQERNIGCVKWFNNKSGYGFITVIKGGNDTMNKDIFAHHTSINVKSDLYKYLVQGEYVEFDIEKIDSNKEHDHQAKNITGISRGPLMCESRLLNKDNIKVKDRTGYKKRIPNTGRSSEDN
jgi:cold shock CspA family protein|tara:strand:+ start:1151 stop:1549 length:399 start_codon:yes stop_codon:yes gene_type:complete